MRQNGAWQLKIDQRLLLASGLPGGNRNNNGTFNNLGNNGNWWSSTESGANAWYWNLNYNNDNVNRNNNDKRLGFSVRCLRDLIGIIALQVCRAFLVNQLDLFAQQDNKPDLLEDLFQAYFDCRKNKRNTINALQFEKYLESNIFRLHEEIESGT
jgi:hypothetical protein